MALPCIGVPRRPTVETRRRLDSRQWVADAEAIPRATCRKRVDRVVAVVHTTLALRRGPSAQLGKDSPEVVEVSQLALRTDVPVVAVALPESASPGLVLEPEMEAPGFFQPLPGATTAAVAAAGSTTGELPKLGARVVLAVVAPVVRGRLDLRMICRPLTAKPILAAAAEATGRAQTFFTARLRSQETAARG